MYFSKIFRHAVAGLGVTALVVACGGGGSAPAVTNLAGPPSLTVQPTSNQLSIRVDGGPAGTGYNVNRLYTAVTVCLPGSPTQCQTIDHVLVDTGSTGLRLLSSAMTPALSLPHVNSAGGQALLNCVQFVDNTFAWGPVAAADLVLGGKSAASVPIQVIADPAFNSPPSACSGGGTAITTASFLGANGIIGLGLFKEDCGAGCVVNAGNGFYYTCTGAGCSGAKASIALQVKNPVPLFVADNNGVLIDLPAASSSGAASLDGMLIFGIGTQSNNQITSGAVLTTDAVGDITTLLAGQTLNRSFIDSGSNGLYFDTATITKCGSSGAGFYCPPSRVTLSAILVGANAVSSPNFSFSIDKATDLFVGGTNTVS